MYDELSDEQREWVSRPSSHPALPEDVRYPLTLGQLHLLAGASERQLRHWTDEELIPAHRSGTHRRYYSAATARALLLARMPPQQVASLIAVRMGGDSGRRLVVMFGSVLASAVDRAGVSEPARSDILQGARALVDHRRGFAGKTAA